ncbi:hypothetical protein [Nonomuraea sp. 10N515B]|uniref:hypothetical protein n=1 Tax=Nonomuraea sp. 10N515B TaxID=3457422 RepID=UPI003FCC96DB
MQQAEARRLGALLSPLHLADYELRCSGDAIAALPLHCWNTEISEAFYGPLQYLELAMRSVMNRELVAHFGRDDWWDAPGAQLNHGGQQRIREVRLQIQRTGLAADAHLISEELPFGFYVSLLGRGTGYDQRLWRPALYRAFPGFRGPRRDLHQKLDYLRVLRNKIAHHGPIHHRHLSADHDTIVECLGYIDTGLATVVKRHSRVPEVLSRRP